MVPVFATIVFHVVPSGLRSILYPVIGDPPLDGAVQLKLICDDDIAVAASNVGAEGVVAEVNDTDNDVAPLITETVLRFELGT